MEKKCCICGMEFNGFGNNPEPIMSGCCCDDCNSKYVIPARLYNITEKPIGCFEITKITSELIGIKDKLGEKGFEHIKTLSPGTNPISIYQNPETEEKVGIVIITK